jgi:hypothetical protein
MTISLGKQDPKRFFPRLWIREDLGGSSAASNRVRLKGFFSQSFKKPTSPNVF